MNADDQDAPDRIAGAPHPRDAAALFGHAQAEDAFLDAWRGGRPPHAWLLTGPRGVGKASFAYRAARALLAHEDAPESLSLSPDHPVAHRVAAGAEPRLKVLTRARNARTGKLATTIGVDVVRALSDFLSLRATDGGWRAVILDAADDMAAAAQNALLKRLEEPPEQTVLFLVCHAPRALLPTIRSRCRALPFAPLGPQDMARALEGAGVRAGESDMAALAALAGGAPGAAVRLAAEESVALYGDLSALLAGAPGLDRPRLIRIAEAAANRKAPERYPLTLDLTVLLAQRLARAGAGAPLPPLTQDEAALAPRLSPDAARARLWAEAAAEAEAAGRAARAVNLDPAQTILDIWLRLDAVAARARIA